VQPGRNKTKGDKRHKFEVNGRGKKRKEGPETTGMVSAGKEGRQGQPHEHPAESLKLVKTTKKKRGTPPGRKKCGTCPKSGRSFLKQEYGVGIHSSDGKGGGDLQSIPMLPKKKTTEHRWDIPRVSRAGYKLKTSKTEFPESEKRKPGERNKMTQRGRGEQQKKKKGQTPAPSARGRERNSKKSRSTRLGDKKKGGSDFTATKPKIEAMAAARKLFNVNFKTEDSDPPG